MSTEWRKDGKQEGNVGLLRHQRYNFKFREWFLQHTKSARVPWDRSTSASTVTYWLYLIIGHWRIEVITSNYIRKPFRLEISSLCSETLIVTKNSDALQGCGYLSLEFQTSEVNVGRRCVQMAKLPPYYEIRRCLVVLSLVGEESLRWTMWCVCHGVCVV